MKAKQQVAVPACRRGFCGVSPRRVFGGGSDVTTTAECRNECWNIVMSAQANVECCKLVTSWDFSFKPCIRSWGRAFLVFKHFKHVKLFGLLVLVKRRVEKVIELFLTLNNSSFKLYNEKSLVYTLFCTLLYQGQEKRIVSHHHRQITAQTTLHYNS